MTDAPDTQTLDVDAIEKMLRSNVAILEAEITALVAAKNETADTLKAKRRELDKAKRMLPRAVKPTATEPATEIAETGPEQ
jgi:hypothetical protein